MTRIKFYGEARRLSENVDFRQNKAKFGEKAQFTGLNEHFEPNFNAVLAERCVFGQPPRRLSYKNQTMIPITSNNHLKNMALNFKSL